MLAVSRQLICLPSVGKVLYLGISDTPAWIVAHANAIAAQRGWTGFSRLQPEYSLAQRDAERDLLPMARAFDMTVTPWSPLAGGLLTGKYNDHPGDEGRLAPGRSPQPGDRARPRDSRRGGVRRGRHRLPAAQVALAWLVHQPGSVIPIIGARSAGQLEDNLGCLDIELTAGHLKRLASLQVTALQPGEARTGDKVRLQIAPFCVHQRMDV